MKLASIGKFLDQPLLTNTLSRKMPHILGASALGYGIYDTFKKPKEERKNAAIKNAVILGSICASSILGAKYIKIGGESLIETVPKSEIIASQSKAINDFISKNNINNSALAEILDKAKSKILSLKSVDTLISETNNHKGAAELKSALFGAAEDISSAEIKGEITKLSTMGLIPVVSGITGGVVADKITGDYSKENTANKIKEGLYQFLANIFMCNVGAGTFLYAAEKLSEKGIIGKLTPLNKSAVVISGILCVGVLGGSKIANFLGDNLVNPVVNKLLYKGDNKQKENERKPELLDIALHTDDIATAGVLSGLKWIEPLLPVMYLVSGYRSATGYRGEHKCPKTLDKTA